MTITRIPIVVCIALLIALSAVPAVAAEVTGTWTTLVKGAPPHGNDMLLTFVFKQEGSKLTGTVATPDETAEITNGRVNGDNISFMVAFSISTFTYQGTIAGDEIKVTVIADNPNFPVGEFTLKRSK